jgi:hypothetical protein
LNQLTAKQRAELARIKRMTDEELEAEALAGGHDIHALADRQRQLIRERLDKIERRHPPTEEGGQ